MSDTTLPAYTVKAYNVSHASENKIHDDAIARKLGFSGGLVPGVEVFAYATHPMVAHYGRAFLERGVMTCRFLKPVYDGHEATVTAEKSANGFTLKVESDGQLCATGDASLPATAGDAPRLDDYPESTPPTERPPADEASLAVGQALGLSPEKFTQDALAQYLSDVRESGEVYSEYLENEIAHPGILLRLCNSALKDNVMLPPWVHTGSTLRHFSTAHVGDDLSVRSKVVANYERKGHRLVDLDCLIVANGTRPIAHVLHTAIYQLRHLAA